MYYLVINHSNNLFSGRIRSIYDLPKVMIAKLDRICDSKKI